MSHINSNICVPQIREQIKSGQTNDQPNVRPPTQMNNIMYIYLLMRIYVVMYVHISALFIYAFPLSLSQFLAVSLTSFHSALCALCK